MNRVTGMWVYQTLDRPDPLAVVNRARQHGMGWVTAQAFNDGHPLDAAWLRELRQATRAHGLRLGVHGYVGRPHPDPANEARLTAQAIDVAQADFAIVDAEAEYESAPGAVSQQFVTAYRTLKPGFPSYFSSFGRPSLHSGLDWATWARAGFAGMPQAYENSNASALTPRACVDDYARFFPRRGIRPTLGCYTPDHGARVPIPRLVQSVREVPDLAFNVYRQGTVTDGELGALAGID
jgi:hypothetical protein